MEKQQLSNFLLDRRAILAIKGKDSNMLEDSSPPPSLLQTSSQGGGDRLDISRTESSRRRNQAQGKLLLVALLENYCMLYDQSKEQNQQLFFILCQYLYKMGIIDSTDFLEEFTAVRSSYKRAFKELVVKALETCRQLEESAKREKLVEHDPQEDHQPIPAPKTLVPSPNLGARLRLPQIHHIPVDITELLDTNSSRFEDDFEEIGLLGRGAFGKVLHCRHVMDSRHYAVKIVKTDSSGGSELAKILREVKLLASLEHHNVVRYYSSWFQYTGTSKEVAASDSEGDDEPISSAASFTSSSPAVIPISNLHPYNSSSQTKPLTLFIQMELCQHTLKNWIEDLNREVNTFRRMEGKILYCFMDLLQGIGCIHDKKYIHRDIKPSNIYWSTPSSCWKIGDFGLATWITVRDPVTVQQEQSYGIGTITYASPEQLEEKRKFDAYSFETDIYSLGLILFELLHPFETQMERVKILTELRLGIVPDEFLTVMPKEAALILWMMSPNPQTRPSIADILKLEWFSQPEAGILKGSVDGELDPGALKEELGKANKRIEELERLNLELTEKLAKFEVR